MISNAPVAADICAPTGAACPTGLKCPLIPAGAPCSIAKEASSNDDIAAIDAGSLDYMTLRHVCCLTGAPTNLSHQILVCLLLSADLCASGTDTATTCPATGPCPVLSTGLKCSSSGECGNFTDALLYYNTNRTINCYPFESQTC